MRTLLVTLFFICLMDSVHAQDGPASKLAGDLAMARSARPDSIDVQVAMRIRSLLDGPSWRILAFDSAYQVAWIRLPQAALLQLAALDEVSFISRKQIPKEELTTGAVDMTLNGLALVARQYPAFLGDSIFLLVKERRFDSEDPDLRGRVFATGLEATQQTAHASQMSTVIAGRGNTSPEARGAAPASRLGSTDFARLLPDPDSVFQRWGVQLQNHSYGTVVENFYGIEAAAYDQQTYARPDLLHVFSAGNAGGSTPASGMYAGLTGVANLSGNFKQAKNVLTVGAVDSAAQPMPLGSRGPAFDGRIKPDLMAYGEDGSSGAAALVSGTAALLQQAWKRTHGGILATASMQRAILINSADDLSVAGPDYRTGFGLLNAYEALRTLLEGRVLEGMVPGGGEQSFSLVVPADCRRLKVTLAWTDRPAALNSTKALVNDLDLVVTSTATGADILPWVPDPSPSLSALQSGPSRKRDTLNTLEQVMIEFPVAGIYELRVRSAPNATAQSFSIAWQLDSVSSFYWTFPAGAPMEAGRRQWIRWRTQIAGGGEVEYATQGANWRPLGSVASLQEGGLPWSVPDTVSVARLRIRPVNGPAIESDPFLISRRPDLRTGFDCMDSFLLHWRAAAGERYRLSALLNDELSNVVETADSQLVLQRAQYPEVFYALTPVMNGFTGIRSATVNYRAQASGCYINSFYLQSQLGTTARFRGGLGTLYGLAQVGLEKWTGSSWSVESGASPVDLQPEWATHTLRQGENRYRMWVRLAAGGQVFSEPITVYYLNGGSMLVYPNPVSGQQPVRVRTEEPGRFRLQVLDLQGRVLRDEPVNSNELVVPAGWLPRGLYVLRFIDRNGDQFTQKLLVQ